MNKNKAAVTSGWLFVLFLFGVISKDVYCRLCDPADTRCAATCAAPNPEPTPTPTPLPTPTPVPTPPPPCLPDVPWCNELVPPAQCSSPAQPCKHNPTTDPDHCELAPSCDPSPTPTPTPTPPPTPPPTGTTCPKPLAPGATVYLNAKPYGQGLDSTVRVRDDAAFCFIIHGVQTSDCHLEGWSMRSQCEMELIGGCPIWQFQTDTDPTVRPCSDNQDAEMSCDHFGNTVYRDDPKTADFEGQPVECGEQGDQYGPNAGFFTIAHGFGRVRACKPDGTGCSPWRSVDH